MTYDEFQATIISYGGNPQWFFYDSHLNEEIGGWPQWPSLHRPEKLGIYSWYYLFSDGKVYKFDRKLGCGSVTHITKEGVEELSKMIEVIIMADMLINGKKTKR